MIGWNQSSAYTRHRKIVKEIKNTVFFGRRQRAAFRPLESKTVAARVIAAKGKHFAGFPPNAARRAARARAVARPRFVVGKTAVCFERQAYQDSVFLLVMRVIEVFYRIFKG